MKILIFGAGSTGRGHLATLLYEGGYRNLTFVEQNGDLVNFLNKKQSYQVHLLGQNERVIEISGFKILSRSNEREVINSFNEAKLVLTAVIAENLENVAEVIAKAIPERRKSGNQNLLNVIGCENLDNASSFLKKCVYKRLDREDLEYAERFIGFPDAMISRVVPLAHTPDYLIAEDYNEWTVRREAFKGEDPKIPFIDIVDNLDARLERKLWIHNGGHATVAYAGFQKGYQYIHEAVNDQEIAFFTGKVMAEIGDAIISKHGFSIEEIDEYKNDLVIRGLIAEMKDEIIRVVRDPLRKLGLKDRLLAPAIYAATNNLPYEHIIESAVNATFYCRLEDIESVKMQEIISTNGFEYFAAETLNLKAYPQIMCMLINIRKGRE